MANLKTGCENAIYQYAPVYRQLNALRYGEYKGFVDKVVRFYRGYYQTLKGQGLTEWVDLPQEFLDDYFSDKPY